MRPTGCENESLPKKSDQRAVITRFLPGRIQVLGWIIIVVQPSSRYLSWTARIPPLPALGVLSFFGFSFFSFRAKYQILKLNQQKNVTSSHGCRTGISSRRNDVTLLTFFFTSSQLPACAIGCDNVQFREFFFTHEPMRQGLRVDIGWMYWC